MSREDGVSDEFGAAVNMTALELMNWGHSAPANDSDPPSQARTALSGGLH